MRIHRRTNLTLALLGLPLLLSMAVFAQDPKPATHRNQVVALGRDGLVAGRVVAIDGPSRATSPLSGLSVYFIQSGSVARSSVTDADGMFVIDGLTPGVYSFVGSGAKGFVAFGVVVEANSDAAAEDSFIVAPAVSPRFVVLSEIVAKYLPKKTPILMEEVEIKASLDFAEQIDDGANRVTLNNGNLVGSLRTVANDIQANGTRVFLVQNDEIISETTAGDNGAFTFESVTPGVYDFVAAGAAGFAAIGVEAVQETGEKTVLQQEAAVQPLPPQGGAVVAQEPPAEQELNTLLTPPGDAQIVSEQVDHAHELTGDAALAAGAVATTDMAMLGDALGCGAACGSTGCGCEEDYFDSGAGCGGCCGGGGGGAWFGGLGPLASAALFAWAITELDDDDNPNTPPPSSPNN